MSNNCKPIGFFDSGLGGISVLKTAYELMPSENYIYYGDNKNAPYGEKSEDMIKSLSLAAGDFLFKKGVKAIVMACNTATSASVIMMREKFKIPVISMEPAVKPAMSALKSGKVLVLATPATVNQPRYMRLLGRLGADDKVVSVGCSGLVDLVENGSTDEESIHAYLDRKIGGMNGMAVDAVVLGCTHYSFIEPHIKSYIEKSFGGSCCVFDGRFGTAMHLQNVLAERDMQCKKNGSGRIEFISSGQAYDASHYKTIFETFEI